MSISKVAVIGGGMMGHGIAVVIARRGGVPVVIKEMNMELAEKALGKAHAMFDKWAKKGDLDQIEVEEKKSLITATADNADLADADLVIEAVPENLSLKQSIWTGLDAIVNPQALFASNTSSLSIADLASETGRPDKFAGLHFFSPPTVMPLVELVKTDRTSQETLRALTCFAEDLGKTVIPVKNVPGFLINRLLMAYLNTAARMACETTLTVQEIDAAARELGWRAGPFFVMDQVGLDVGNEVANVLHRGYGDRMKPSSLLKMLFEKGRLGRKTGIGFYSYGVGNDDINVLIAQAFPNRTPGNAAEAVKKMMDAIAMEALRCVYEGVASEEDVEIGCAKGIFYPDGLGGPIGWAKQRGLDLAFHVHDS